MIGVRIITCPQWDARPPSHAITHTRGPAQRIIFHHTAGHHRELGGAGESLAEAKQYARDVQAFHMDGNGWIDSGHNFLVTRSGRILQGRWQTVSAIQQGRMVVSAHCPGQNDQVGIEHEHAGTERMTEAQFAASARLQAWIASEYGRRHALPVEPHSAYFATACPANLADEIEAIRDLTQRILEGRAGTV